MDIRKFRFQWGSGALTGRQKYEALRKRAERDAQAWLVGFFWHRDARAAIAQLTPMIDELETKILQLDALQANERDKVLEAEATCRAASPIAGNTHAPREEWEAAHNEYKQAENAGRAARIAITSADERKHQLRQSLPAMKSLRGSLMGVAAPPARPDFAAFLLGMIEQPEVSK